MIEVQHLTKRYGPVTAVDDVSFSVGSGEILGFLGPNGAGKTTTMRVITGYMPASDGTVTVAGHDVFTAPIEAKRRTGYLPETPPLYPDMTVRDYVTFVARIKGVPSREVRGRVDEVMRRTHVADMAGAALRQALEGLPAARRPGPGPHPQPRGAGARRADRRARPQADHRVAAAHQGAGRQPHGGAQHAHPPRGLADLPAGGHHQQGAGRGGRHPREPHRPAARQRDDVPPGAGVRRRRRGGAGRRAGRDPGPQHRDRQRLRERRGRQRARPRRAPRTGGRGRQPRLGPAGAAADAA